MRIRRSQSLFEQHHRRGQPDSPETRFCPGFSGIESLLDVGVVGTANGNLSIMTETSRITLDVDALPEAHGGEEHEPRFLRKLLSKLCLERLPERQWKVEIERASS